MTFVADLSKLMERGILDINNPTNHPQSSSCSIDIPIGDMYRINQYRLDHGKDGWLEENGRTLFGEAEYIVFTKDHISLSSNYELFIDPRSSLARLGLQASKFENDFLSKTIDTKKLPQYDGRIPLVVRTMRTNLCLPEGSHALQILVAEKGTQPLDTNRLIELSKNRQVEVLRDGKEVEPQNCEFPLTFHPTIKVYRPSQYSHVLTPHENTESCFQTFDLSDLFREDYNTWADRMYAWSLTEDCFYLGSTKETVRIDNRHLGMLTQSYPHKWTRVVYIDRSEHPPNIDYLRWYGKKEVVEELVEPSGYVHLAPWINPGSYGNQTLEIASKVFSHNKVLVKHGDPACSIKIFELDEECGPYCGKYRGQEGPLVSHSYKDAVNCLKE